MPLSVVKWACFHIDRAKIETPARIESRPSNLPVVRPIVAIVNALASAPGRITNPVCSAVKFWRFCRYTGSTNTVAYRQIPSTPPNTTPTASCRHFRLRRSTTRVPVVSSCHTNAISDTVLITPYVMTSRESNQTSRSPRSRSEEHTSELQSHSDLVCRLLLDKKKLAVRSQMIGPADPPTRFIRLTAICFW